MNIKLTTINQNAKLALTKAKSLMVVIHESIQKKNQHKISNFKVWIDTENGLVWELKTIENIKEIYSLVEAQSYVEQLNQSNYGGYSTWRLPTIEELESLKSGTKNNGYFIKKPLSKNTDWAYWSSSFKEKNKNMCFIITMLKKDWNQIDLDVI